MMKVTQKELRELVRFGKAVDISHCTNEDRTEIEKKELYLEQIGYAHGIYGCNGMLFQGHNTKTLYAITGRTQAIYIFG